MTPQQLVQGVLGLVSLPDVCMRISQMVDSPYCSASDIGKVLGKDAALTARLLRIVNSAFYQFPSKIETVSRAITIVGNRELRDLVLAATVAGVFEKISNDVIDVESFWRHGIYTGIVARIIAGRCRVLHNERLFVAGLMHDIGRLIISYKLPNKAREILDLMEKSELKIHQAEQQVLGFDHAQVGAELMKSWSLPESHQMSTLFHHYPEATTEFTLEASIIHLADAIADLAEEGERHDGQLENIHRAIWNITNVTPASIDTILIEARDQFIDTLALFRPGKRRSSSYAA